MTKPNNGKYIAGFGLSFLIVSIASSLLVILKEDNEALKNWMNGLLGRHWITHGAFVIFLFLILGFVFSGIRLGKNWKEQRLMTLIIAGTILGGLILGGFFLFE
jgi:hypothetical protein